MAASNKTESMVHFSVSAANSQEISIYLNKYLFGQNKYFLAYFWEEGREKSPEKITPKN